MARDALTEAPAYAADAASPALRGARVALLGPDGGDAREAVTRSGYRAAPLRGSGPAVLVLPDGPEIDGLARAACERLARAGFLALAVPCETDGAAQALAGAVRTLLSDAAASGPRIGALGFGAGGTAALGLAAQEPRIAAVVSVEGVPPTESAADALPPTLLVFGAGDAACAKPAAAFAARAPTVRLHAEPGATAGFFDEGRPDRHVALAAARAWDAALAFLRAAGG